MKTRIVSIIAVCLMASIGNCFANGEIAEVKPTSSSGVGKATVVMGVGPDGLTTEQRNIKQRYELEGRAGAIKHVYIVSAMSGQCILYSTARGKITSSGKRLTPYEVAAIDGEFVNNEFFGFAVNIGGQVKMTPEVLQDDGTYGNSEPYVYWFDVRGQFHQHFRSDATFIHITDYPMSWKGIIMNVETDYRPQ